MKTINIEECAEFLNVDKATALRLAGTGKLPGAKIGKAWVFLVDDLVEYLRNEVRVQQRQRSIEDDAQVSIDKVVSRSVPMLASMSKPGRKARVLPDLSKYGF